MDWQVTSSIFSSVATIIGWCVLICSAWWFYKRRQRYPRANYTHKIEHYNIDANNTLLRVLLVIENKGEVLLKLEKGIVRIYRLKPWPESALLHPLSEGRTAIKDGQDEVDWPMIAKQDLQLPTGPTEIEPGEIAEIPVDFVLDSNLQVAIVYSYLGNSSKAKHQIGWDKSTTYRLDENCNPETQGIKGSVTTMDTNISGDESDMIQKPDRVIQRKPKPEQQDTGTPAPKSVNPDPHDGKHTGQSSSTGKTESEKRG